MRIVSPNEIQHAGRQSALIVGADDREIVRASIYPYSAIGRLISYHSETGAMLGHCSSFLVSECHIMTNQHCLPKNPDVKLAWQPAVTVQPGMRDIQALDASHVIKKGGSEWKTDRDWAVIRLPGTPGKSFGKFCMENITPNQLTRDHRRFELSGYPSDFGKGDVLSRDPNIKFLGRAILRGNHAAAFHGDTCHGGSGGPIYDTSSGKNALLWWRS